MSEQTRCQKLEQSVLICRVPNGIKSGKHFLKNNNNNNNKNGILKPVYHPTRTEPKCFLKLLSQNQVSIRIKQKHVWPPTMYRASWCSFLYFIHPVEKEILLVPFYR